MTDDVVSRSILTLVRDDGSIKPGVYLATAGTLAALAVAVSGRCHTEDG
jgi:hypothetical protein